jgi:bile-acid 7alpha-dehydratase
MDIAQLVELESIKRLKYKYMRCVDQKLWDEIVDCFTEDVEVAYDSGRHRAEGREVVIGFLRASMPASKLTSHRVHQPEIDFTGPDTASATWAMEDAVINLARRWADETRSSLPKT